MSDPFSSLSSGSIQKARAVSAIGSAHRAKVLFDYSAQAPNQISIRAGQVINIVSYGGPGGWSKAEEIGSGKLGYFPSDYVELMAATSQPQPHQPPTNLNPTSRIVPKAAVIDVAPKLSARVLYDFKASNPSEMTIHSGEVIDVLYRGPSGGWCKGLRGAFPTNYVEFLPVSTGTTVEPSISSSNSFESLQPNATRTNNKPNTVNVDETNTVMLHE